MQTMMIDSKNARFVQLKKILDDKIEQHRKDRKMHTLGRNTYYNEGKVELIEYIYGFSDEDGIPASVANASNDTDPTFGTNDNPTTNEIKSYIQELNEAGVDEKTLYEGLNNKSISDGWTADDIAAALGQPKAAIMANFEKYGINFGEQVITPETPRPGGGTGGSGGGDSGGSGGGSSDPTVLPYNVGISEATFSPSEGELATNRPMINTIRTVARPGKTIDWSYIPEAGSQFSGFPLSGIAGGTCTPSSGTATADALGTCTFTVMGSSQGNYRFQITDGISSRTFVNQTYTNIYSMSISTDPSSITAGTPFSYVFSDWPANSSWTAKLERYQLGVLQEDYGSQNITLDAHGSGNFPTRLTTPGFYTLSITDPAGSLAGRSFSFTVEP